MEHFNYFPTKLILTTILLMIVTGCKECSGIIETKIWGTATVNGKEYEDKTSRGWNTGLYRPSIKVYPHYQLFGYNVALSPKGLRTPEFEVEYEVYFYVTTDDKQLRTDYAYKIEYNKDLEVSTFTTRDIARLLAYDKSKITPNKGDGVVRIFTGNSKIPKSLEGEFVLQHIDSLTMLCSGYYSLNTPVNSSDNPFVIKGKFEADIFTSNRTFLEN